MRKLLLVRRVVGRSMEPTFKAGDIVIASGLLGLRRHDVVVLNHNGLDKIKRLESFKGNKVFVVGDNSKASTDSRSFGWLEADKVQGKVIWPRLAR